MPRLLTPDRMLGAGLVIACAVLWFAVIPVYVKGVDQSFFPRVAVGWIALCAAAIALLPQRSGATDVAGLDDELPVVPMPAQGSGEVNLRQDADAEAAVVHVPQGHAAQPSVYVVVLIWGAYAVAIGYLGFYIATWAMLVASMAYLGIRSPRALVIRPTVTLVIVYMLLERVLRFRLPEAFWQ